MHVWIFQTGEPLHSDPGSPRPMRAMNLANALNKQDHKVTIWSSGFDHVHKSQRMALGEKIIISDKLCIRLIKSPGYRSNIGIGRLFDHAVLALNLKKALNSVSEVPDVAFIGYPPIEFAFVASNWLGIKKIPTILDVKDQWPPIFIDAFPGSLQPIMKLIFSPYFFMGKKAMRSVTALSSMTKSFLDWAIDFSGRKITRFDSVNPLSPVKRDLSDGEAIAAKQWWCTRGVVAEVSTKFYFVGSFSRAFNFDPIRVAAMLAIKHENDWQFVLCGDGQMSDEVKSMFSDLPNVVLPGWVDYPKASILANMSILALAPYKNTVDFQSSVPNKVIDYLSYGKPIASPLGGEVMGLIEEKKIGFSYDPDSQTDLYLKLKTFCDKPNLGSDYSYNASKLFVENYSGEVVYARLISVISQLVK